MDTFYTETMATVSHPTSTWTTCWSYIVWIFESLERCFFNVQCCRAVAASHIELFKNWREVRDDSHWWDMKIKTLTSTNTIRGLSIVGKWMQLELSTDTSDSVVLGYRGKWIFKSGSIWIFIELSPESIESVAHLDDTSYAMNGSVNVLALVIIPFPWCHYRSVQMPRRFNLDYACVCRAMNDNRFHCIWRWNLYISKPY